MGSSLNQGPPPWVPNIARTAPSKKDPKRDPNLENYPNRGEPRFGYQPLSRNLAPACGHGDTAAGIRNRGPMGLGFRVEGLGFR